MDNVNLLSETTTTTTTDDDDRAQGDGSSSSIHSDEENSSSSYSFKRMFLSNDDIDKCLYVTNINWRRRFSVSEQRMTGTNEEELPRSCMCTCLSFVGNNNH